MLSRVHAYTHALVYVADLVRTCLHVQIDVMCKDTETLTAERAIPAKLY